MKDEYEKQFERFHHDVANHTVAIVRDDGIYRHLRCSKGSYAYSFDIVTWPGYLCYSGDMGCFVFSRIADMFDFFRGRQTALIDRDYLAGKAVAVDKPDGLERFSDDLFEKALRDDFDSFTDGWADDEKTALWEDIEAEVLPARHDGMNAAIQAAMAFRHKGQEVFTDFWDHRFEEFTLRFWWCCYAIPWAIEQYDAMKRECEQQAN